MPLDTQVIEIYKNKPAPPDKYILEDMRKNADAVFNDKTEIIGIHKYEDRTILGYLPIRIFYPGDCGPYPVLIYFHGGGFVMHNIASHDSLCRKLATEFNRIVVSVDYRLAPEFKYPACMEDGNAAFKWVYENAESFGGIPEKIILSGDSAGATISASVCLSSINNRLPLPEGLVLFYGMYGAVDDNDSNSMTMFGNGEYVLPKKMSDWCMGLYIPDGTDTSDPYLYPGKADNFAGFPKTVIVTAEYDPLRDDGETFYRQLKESGCDASLIRADGLMHGFMLYWHRLDKAEEIISNIKELI